MYEQRAWTRLMWLKRDQLRAVQNTAVKLGVQQIADTLLSNRRLRSVRFVNLFIRVWISEPTHTTAHLALLCRHSSHGQVITDQRTDISVQQYEQKTHVAMVQTSVVFPQLV